MRRSILASAFALTMTFSAQAEELNFGIISTETSSALKAEWEPFLADMNKKTGLAIKGFYASDYAGVIEAMRFNKVQVAWFGNKSAMEAVDRASAEVFAQSVNKDGNPGYWSLIIVNKDSPLKSLDDLLKCDKSLDFGIGDPNSTSGFLVPMTFIFAKNHVDPRSCFKTVRTANHEANILAVANKLVGAATNNTEEMTRLEKNNPAKAADIRVIWKSVLIPADPLVWRKDLDPAIKTKISDFLFSYGVNDEREKQVLAGLNWAPFKKSSNDQLLPIRQMEVGRQMMQLEGDTSIAADKKAEQMAKLQEQFKNFDAQIAALQK